MTLILSNSDALLVAVPLVGILFAGYFRLDELVGKSKKPVKSRRPMVGCDEHGLPICADPDGSIVHSRAKKR